MPTRFPGGINSTTPKHALEDMPFPDLVKDYVFLARAQSWTDVLAGTPLSYTVTVVGTGAPTYSDAGGTTGALLLTTSANAADQVSVQSKGRVARTDSSKYLNYSTSVTSSSTANTTWVVGLTSTDTAPIGAAGSEWTGVADGMFFYKAEASAAIGFAIRSGSATILNLTNLGTITAGIVSRLSYSYNPGNGKVKIWVNNTMVSESAVTTFPASTMYQQISVRTVDANARTMTIDHVFSCQER